MILGLRNMLQTEERLRQILIVCHQKDSGSVYLSYFINTDIFGSSRTRSSCRALISTMHLPCTAIRHRPSWIVMHIIALSLSISVSSVSSKPWSRITVATNRQWWSLAFRAEQKWKWVRSHARHDRSVCSWCQLGQSWVPDQLAVNHQWFFTHYPLLPYTANVPYSTNYKW